MRFIAKKEIFKNKSHIEKFVFSIGILNAQTADGICRWKSIILMGIMKTTTLEILSHFVQIITLKHECLSFAIHIK